MNSISETLDDAELGSKEFSLASADDDALSSASNTNIVDKAKLAELNEERKALARSENKAVTILRFLVLIVLIITASSVSIGIYRYSSNDQESNFKHDFDSHAEKLLQSFHESVERKLEAVDALGVSITSYANSTGATFPNVTLPDFAVRGANTRVLGDCLVLNFFPLVTDENRAGWEAYENENRHLFDQEFIDDTTQQALQNARFGDQDPNGRHVQEKEDEETVVETEEKVDALGLKIYDEIYDLNADGSSQVAPKDSGPYLPVWQISPVVPMSSVLNFNALSHPAGAGSYREILKSKKAVLDLADNLNQEHFGNTGAYFALVLSMSQYRGSVEMFLGEPTSALVYPVFDSLDPSSRELAGVIGTNIYWRVNFQDVLPPNAKGIICVISNTRGQKFTYRVDGSEPTYLGNGDLHDPKYDSMVRSADVATFLAAHASLETHSYTVVGLNDEYCGYSIHIYPSEDTEGVFVNSQPLTFTILVVGVFLVTSLIFISYDCIVARRQRIVMDRAVASSAIVSSLFPSQVRQQLYQESKDRQKAAKHKRSIETWKNTRDDSSGRGDDFFNGNSSGHLSTTSGGPPANKSTTNKPIANLFANTTIMFADMAGFTAWSASRTPEQVFELLETVYSAFDNIAERRNVFKVETIGDCYVAVTGLPAPQEDHAVIMAKFAREIISKMLNLTRELADTMGEDTADLQMRVGLHSGSVTAGVLRGKKSRFQLFGDAMNTAARMESNGVKGKIHVSQATADELRARGKPHWVTPRENTIFAKGKGELQTYWVFVTEKPKSISS